MSIGKGHGGEGKTKKETADEPSLYVVYTSFNASSSAIIVKFG